MPPRSRRPRYAAEHGVDLRTVELDVVWVSSSSTRGGTPPYLSPYFAAKAAMDSLAISYASELTRWGIETSIIVPGAFTKRTNHFVHAGAPADVERAAEYSDGPYAGCQTKP
jgi:NAD(P)-dependent dehydrogenase (short-subunit alcohol dehydrogenase family)